MIARGREDGFRPGERIAVIGAGVAGMTAAWLLNRKYRVHLFEQRNYAGGHTRTLKVPGDDGNPVAVDMGFIVMNHRNYPLLTRIFRQLNTELGDSDMSFSYHNRQTAYEYSGSGIRGLFAGRGNWARPHHYRMIRNIMRFNRDAVRALDNGEAGSLSLGEFLSRGRYGRECESHYILPMSAAIWSAPQEQMRQFPAESLLRFFANHGLLGIRDRPQWKYVKGGSRTYVDTMLKEIEGEVTLECAVSGVSRSGQGVEIRCRDGSKHAFDYAIIASHADEALALLDDADPEEANLLGRWKYEPNSVVLHTDSSVMPESPAAWASWNAVSFTADENSPVALSYHMNRLQRLPTRNQYFVSLNMDEHLDPEAVIHREVFTHPTYTNESVSSQSRLPELNGRKRTFFCGSYFGYGFHEDAVRSAVDVAEKLGVSL